MRDIETMLLIQMDFVDMNLLKPVYQHRHRILPKDCLVWSLQSFAHRSNLDTHYYFVNDVDYTRVIQLLL